MIHPLSGILSIADAYLTLTSSGPNRAPLLPHDAIGLLLHQASRGVFDTNAVRAFLNQLCLFPIGSFVQLDDGATATVIRRHDNHYSQPIVQIHGGNGDPVLLREDSRKIVRPIANEPERQMRITPDLMTSLSLDNLASATV